MDKLQNLVDDVKSKGWTFSDNLIPTDIIQSLLTEARELDEQGSLRQAKIGQKELKQKAQSIRKDKIRWIDNLRPSPPQQLYLNIMNDLRGFFAQRLYLGLNSFEAHLAAYPEGSFYKKHLDQFSTDDARQLTCILYLNSDWREENGGQLRIYNENNPNEVDQELLPVFGRFVMLLSPSVYHEVLPTRQTRYSVTGWLKSANIQQDPLALIL